MKTLKSLKNALFAAVALFALIVAFATNGGFSLVGAQAPATVDLDKVIEQSGVTHSYVFRGEYREMTVRIPLTREYWSTSNATLTEWPNTISTKVWTDREPNGINFTRDADTLTINADPEVGLGGGVYVTFGAYNSVPNGALGIGSGYPVDKSATLVFGEKVYYQNKAIKAGDFHLAKVANFKVGNDGNKLVFKALSNTQITVWMGTEKGQQLLLGTCDPNVACEFTTPPGTTAKSLGYGPYGRVLIEGFGPAVTDNEVIGLDLP